MIRSKDAFFRDPWLTYLALEELHIRGALLRGAGWISQYL